MGAVHATITAGTPTNPICVDRNCLNPKCSMIYKTSPTYSLLKVGNADRAPHAELLKMRSGTAHFARVLHDLNDAEIAHSLRRREIIAEVSENARSVAIFAKSLWEELTAEEKDFTCEVSLTATLPVHALRHLFTHTARSISTLSCVILATKNCLTRGISRWKGPSRYGKLPTSFRNRRANTK